MKIAHNAILQEKKHFLLINISFILNLADNVRFFISSFSFLSYTKNSMKKKVTKVKLHKALQPSFIKRMYYMRFLGNLQKLRKRRVERISLYTAYRQYHSLYRNNLQMNHMYLKGYVAIKRMKNLFGIKEEEIRKAISNVSSLL